MQQVAILIRRQNLNSGGVRSAGIGPETGRRVGGPHLAAADGEDLPRAARGRSRAVVGNRTDRKNVSADRADAEAVRESARTVHRRERDLGAIVRRREIVDGERLAAMSGADCADIDELAYGPVGLAHH